MDGPSEGVEVCEVVGDHLDEGPADVTTVEADATEKGAVRRLEDTVRVVTGSHPRQLDVIGEQPDVRLVVDLGELVVQPPGHDAVAARAEQRPREITVLTQ
ncbi:hypothetical protein H7K45_02275 [Mycobacterium yunnanensis]|uniref:Uncharacterized protein n=1 Tax=Mycobacterium yunnanensis TaxID=368477 RepID=A0A9X2YX30_9MYCO|nr:hypothetical protein [Mycobacterium yunnanensis]MCV7419356.1 hypothetical protein [Mycobacterium yunnanensis]